MTEDCAMLSAKGGRDMATAAAAIVAKARRDIQHDFFSRDAVRPDRAIAFDADSHVQRRVFERWRRSGVMRQEADGRFWLDVVAYDVELRKQHGRVRTALLLIIAILLAGLAIGLFSTSHA